MADTPSNSGPPSSFKLSDGGPDWQGMLKWSLSHSDGTSAPRQMSEEDKKWFMEAMQEQTLDVIKRMKEIAMIMNMPREALEAQGVTTEDMEALLEELQEHVESIDMANDLHAIGGLVPLLNFLKSPNASLRSKAAEVVSTMVQNNPKSQQLVMDAKGLESLLSNFMSDSDITVRTKSLAAISSLIRNNNPGVAAFRLANGYAGLKDALVSDNEKFQRYKAWPLSYLHIQQKDHDACDFRDCLGELFQKASMNPSPEYLFQNSYTRLLKDHDSLGEPLDALNFLTVEVPRHLIPTLAYARVRKGLQVLQYLLNQNPNDSSVAVDLGFLRLLISLVSNADADIRQAALHNLVEMARNGKVDMQGQVSEGSQLRQVLESQIDKIQSMNQEELGAVKEERQFLDSLWQLYFDEPSALRQCGLVVLPGEDEPPPDVSSKLFEPVLRAWSAPRQPSEQPQLPAETSTEKPPLLLMGSAPRDSDDNR